MYVSEANDVTYFDYFGVEDIPKEIKTFIGRSSSIKTNIFRIQGYDPITCGYFCIGFIDFLLPGKTLIEYTNLFLPNVLKKYDDIIKVFYLVMFKNGNSHEIYPICIQI